MVNVDKPEDEYLFQVLAHGRRRYSEIKFLGEHTRWNNRSLANRLSELPEKYELIATEEENGEIYYYRKDVGPLIRQPKPEAYKKDVLQLLESFEQQLGLTNKRGNSSELPTAIFSMINLADTHKNLLSSDDLLERFFNIFDEIIETCSKLFRDPGSIRRYQAIPTETLILFFILVDKLQHEWKLGNENVEFDSCIRRRIVDLVLLVEIVPPGLGELLRGIITNVADRKADRESYKSMIRSGNYEINTLVRHAHFTFSNHSELYKIRDELHDLRVDSDHETAQTIQEIIDALRRRISELSDSPP